jgi:hypothetical protein
MLMGGMALARDDDVAGAHAAINAATPIETDVSVASADLERIRSTDSMSISSGVGRVVLEG